MNLNDCDCITFDKHISLQELNEKIDLEECLISEKEPNHFEHTEQFIDTIFQYILAEKLKDKDLIRLVNKIFNHIC